MLAQSEVAQYLLDHGFVAAAAIVDGDMRVVLASRRNRNFKVISDAGPSYLLKHGLGAGKTATIEHESKVYEYLGSTPHYAGLRGYLPRYYSFDADRSTLILELLPDAVDFRQYHVRRGRFPTTIAAQLGAALSLLHAGGQPSATAGFHARTPWALSLHQPGLDLFREASNANLRLIRILQNTPAFPRMLDELRQGWRVNSLIHHDIKWDNCLILSRSRAEDTPKLRIVDWEFAGWGDSAWDVAGVFSNYMSVWLSSIPISGLEPPDRFLDLAAYPLDRMQPAILAFWSAYVTSIGLRGAESQDFLLRAVRYSGARMAQTAFEQMQPFTQLTGNVICLLQLGLNIMERPHEAAAHLLGIPPVTPVTA